MDLNFSGTDDVFALNLNGTPVAAGSTAGAVSSGADVESSLLTGSGLLHVVVPTALDGVRLWDGGTTDIGSTGDGFSDGGSGTWSTSIQNWDAGAGVAHEGWNNAALDDEAVFDGTAGTVTLGGDINLGDLVFEDTAGSGYTITGNTLNFAAGSTIVAHADGVTIESGITGSPDVEPRQGGNQNLTFAPTSADMTLGTITRPGDNYVTLGGTTTGNSLVSIPKGVNNAKVRKNGSGTWTVGNVYGGFIYIDDGNLVVNGELTSDYRWIELNGGVLHYNNPGAVKGPSSGSSSTLRFKIDGGSIDNSSGSAITTSTYNPSQEWRGNWTFIGSNGAASDLDLGNGAVTLVGGDREVTVQNAAATLTVGGAISDGGNDYGLTKAGAGTLALSGTSTYTGPTSINEGTLQVDGSIAASSMTTVNAGGTLSGSGTVGAVTVSGGTVSPGSSVGTLPAGNTAWTDTSSYLFEIDDAIGTAGAAGGPGWDLLDITGTLDLSALSTGGFTIDIDTLALGGGTTPGAMTNFLDSSDYAWEFVRTSGGVLPFAEGDFLFDVSGVTNAFKGTFGISHLGDSLYVTYTAAIPEPSTCALATLSLLSLGGAGWRRRRRA